MSRAVVLALATSVAIGCGNASASREVAAPMQTKVAADTSVPAPQVTGVVELEHAFERAAQIIEPSVVSITSVRTVRPAAGAAPGPFGELFGLQPPSGPSHGLGSGVIIDKEGHILTNNHVVDGADEVEVILHDDRKVTARVIGTDPQSDIAVIKIDAPDLVPAKLGDSRALRVGQWVVAYGSPFGLSKTVSTGIVSALGRGGAGITEYGDFIQTDAAINPGNSGGPLMDLAGRVVAINTAIASHNGGSNGVGFAIPMHVAKPVMEQLLEHGEVRRGWLGIIVAELSSEMASSFGYTGKGILVQDVVGDGPAAKGGLRSGDIIVGLQGAAADDVDDFRNEIAAMGPKKSVRVDVWRDGKVSTLNVELGRLPGNEKGSAPTGEAAGQEGKLGLWLDDIDAEAAQRHGLPLGKGALIVKVEPGSPAAKSGLRPGDILEEVQGENVKTAADAKRLLGKAPKDRPLRVRVRRGEFGHFIVIPR